ncbi:lipopolysaccharide assembly protein LapB [Marinobacter sp. HL-58]|uniref:tetratricopeptide repeat protein n=1 Tax=Marinobacter sp. HL-58 TaxID=1479237 RepID=UPI000487E52A|nr:bacterial transcriptional activator domain-containing protein [Marinobacter sp. HL-58]KPQ01964.1 MAG: T2bSS MSH-type system platform MshN [Marinobacter sp. HL-58]
MSLLNDALRAAEQRQNRPEAPGAYVGEQPQSRNRRPLLMAVLVILVLMIAATGGYWIFSNTLSLEPTALESDPSPEQPVRRETVVAVEDRPDTRAVETVNPAPANEEPGPEPRQEPTPKPVAAQGRSAEPSTEQGVQEATAPEVTQPEATAESAPPAEEEESAKSEESVAREDEKPSAEVSTAGVKQTPETPAALDRSTARELEKLLARGSVTDAERRLASLTQEQTAPRSRYVVARALLVDGKQDQALGWLPETVAAGHSRLRLLRARALHANGDLTAAVDTLSSDVPPVEDHAEYRVTLATLLQQQGENSKAARHWAELIAWDDSQGPWWVGLAIALEAQGEQAGAARAYRQAAELPGLPRSLADYVQQRLRALRAG